MKKAELELLSEKVHKVYCEQYLKDHGKPYWTDNDYSKLDDRTKEYDRAIVRFMESYADLVSRERAIKFAVEIMTPYTTDYPSILKARFKNKYDKWREQK